MGEVQRVLKYSHPIGRTGRFSVSTARGRIRVHGVDGEVARVEIRYPIAEASAAADPRDDGVVDVTPTDGELRLEQAEDQGGLRRWLGRTSVRSIDFEAWVPRAASVTLWTVSGELDVEGLRGDLALRTVSGDATASDISGRLKLESVSGTVRVQGGRLSLKGSTASGDLFVGADPFEQVELSAVSGDIELNGSLLADCSHRVESVSGDLVVATDSGLTAALRSLSGRITSDVPVTQRSESGGRVAILGDGKAALQFRTVSGGLRLRRSAQALPQPIPLPEPTPVTPSPGPTQPGDQALATLQALERGEIDVEEAERRLAGAAHG
jgi:hypothetical protein